MELGVLAAVDVDVVGFVLCLLFFIFNFTYFPRRTSLSVPACLLASPVGPSGASAPIACSVTVGPIVLILLIFIDVLVCQYLLVCWLALLVLSAPRPPLLAPLPLGRLALA